ncbi:hypothetical protein NE237_004151 [Protea cynaroides]|uniref:Uncharacterized protein n=1 Tax=Protea cynaroides TaxID=273540 RepID=A0A9Q0QTB7_9MAGN|nr:hypothetical protein NE237_004151 [Protea cynaroides]
MKFASDLGPTAQKVANRKLQQCQAQANGQNSKLPAPKSTRFPATSTQRGSIPKNGLISADTSSYFLDKLRKHIGAPLRQETVHLTPFSDIQLGAYHCTSGIGDLNFRVGMTSSSSGQSTMMLGSNRSGSSTQPTELDSQSRLPRVMPNDNDCYIVSSRPSQEVTDGFNSSQPANPNGENQAITAQCSSYGVGAIQGSTDPGCSQLKTNSVQAVLDLSYLKSRLSEMNSSNQCRLVKPELQLGLAPETEKPASNASGSHQKAPGYSHEAGPSNGRQSFSAMNFKPREVSFNASNFPENQQKELSAEELSFNALSLQGRAPIQSYLAALNADGLYPDVMSFDERALGGRKPSFTALPSLPPLPPSLDISLPVDTHQAELINSPRILPFDAMGLHERALGHNLQTDLMNSPRGLSFNAASLQERAPARFYQGEPSAPVLSFSKVSLHEKAPVIGQQAEPRLGVLSLQERAPLRRHRAEQGSSWGLHFDEMGFHHEPNPVAEREGRVSLNAPISSQQKPPVTVIALQAQVGSRGQSLHPRAFHEKPPVHDHQTELTTRAFLDDQQPPSLDDQQPDLNLQL